MTKSNHKIFPWHPGKCLSMGTWSLLHVIIISVAILLSIMIIGCSAWMFYAHVKNENLQFERQQTSQVSDSDTRANPNDTASKADRLLVLESKVRQLEYQVKQLNDNEERIVSDIRQESNNIINKFNAWLGFWIAILAIFGGLIPLVIQYILNNKSRKEFEEAVKQMVEMADCHQIELLVSCIAENKEITDSSCREAFIRNVLNNTFNSFCELLELSDEKGGYIKIESEQHIINALVQYIRLINLLKTISDGRKVREYNILLDKLKSLLKDIISHKKEARSQVWDELRSILPYLSTIPCPVEMTKD